MNESLHRCIKCKKKIKDNPFHISEHGWLYCEFCWKRFKNLDNILDK